MTDTKTGQRVDEVEVSHSQRIEAQCYELHHAPPLGALLRVGSPPVYAVVREIWHEPLDPSRPLAPGEYRWNLRTKSTPPTLSFRRC